MYYLLFLKCHAIVLSICRTLFFSFHWIITTNQNQTMNKVLATITQYRVTYSIISLNPICFFCLLIIYSQYNILFWFSNVCASLPCVHSMMLYDFGYFKIDSIWVTSSEALFVNYWWCRECVLFNVYVAKLSSCMNKLSYIAKWDRF